MKKLVSGILMALSTYTVIPVPISVWRDDVFPLLAVFLPIVGCITGLVWYAIARLMISFAVPAMITAAVLCLYPHIITGFFHLDGYMDCADAVLSRRDLDTRRRILKDSHVGAFAVIALAVLLIITYSFWAELKEPKTFASLILAPVVCRCVSGWSVTALRSLSTSQYAGVKKDSAGKTCGTVIIIEFIAALAASAFCGCFVCTLIPAVVSAVTVMALYRSFDGMSGDIAGCAVTVGEMAAAVSLCIWSLI